MRILTGVKSGIIPALASLLLTVSCAVAPRPSPTGPTPGRPAEVKPCPAGTVSLVNRNLGGLRSIETTLNMGISLSEGGFSARVQAGLVADRDSNLRLRAYAGPVCVLDAAVAGDSIWAYVPAEAAMLVGTVEEAVRSAAEGDMAYAAIAVDLREILFPSPFVADSCTTSRLDRRTCQIVERLTKRPAGRLREVYPRPDGEPVPARLRLLADLRERRAEVELGKGRLRKLEFLRGTAGDSAARYEVTATYSDYRRTGGAVFPHQMAVELPDAGLNLTLSFERVKTNVAIPAETFRVQTPDGVKILKFRELERPDSERPDTRP